MPGRDSVDVAAVRVGDPEVDTLLDALTADLAAAGYTEEESFGYSGEQLEAQAVHLVGSWRDGRLVGIGGLEVGDDGVGELKRFFVVPEHRGHGVADAVVEALLAHARDRGLTLVRLETGDAQHAAIGFYRRHGFVDIPRFGPYVASARSVCMERTLGAPTNRA